MIDRLAVLVGVPCERGAFIRAALDPQRDYARRYAADPVTAWEGADGYGARVAMPIQALLAHARAVSATARHSVGIRDLAEATRRSDVVVLLAHWKGASVTRDDLVMVDPKRLAEALSADGGPEDVAPQDECAALARKIAQCREDQGDRIAALLDEHVHRQPRHPHEAAGGGFPSVAHPQTIAAERRTGLDERTTGLVRPGNRLELVDGMHDMASVERSIAANFRGIVDLTNCESTILARRIDRQRGGACRIVQFQTMLDPEVACLALQQTVALIASGQERDYLRARARAVAEVEQALNSEVRRQRPPWWQRWMGRWRRPDASHARL